MDFTLSDYLGVKLFAFLLPTALGSKISLNFDEDKSNKKLTEQI